MEWFDHDRLEGLLSVEDAADALEQALDGPPGDDPPRVSVPLAHGELLLMPSERSAYGGIKTTLVAEDRPDRTGPRVSGLYLLWDAHRLTALAAFDAASLTTLRTPALSVVATRRLGAPSASRLVVFGAGPQAWGHVQAMAAIRPVTHVDVVGRSRAPTEELVDRCRALGLQATVADDRAVRQADIVCTCTTARQPLFDGRLLGGGAHVNAVGAHLPDVRELDDATIARASVVVETRAAALAEAGDILIPLRAGVVGPEVIAADLAELVAGRGPGPAGLTVFKSVGVAFADLAVAAEAYRRSVA